MLWAAPSGDGIAQRGQGIDSVQMLQETIRPLRDGERADLEQKLAALPRPQRVRVRVAKGCLLYTLGTLLFFLPFYYFETVSQGEWVIMVASYLGFLGLLIALAIPVASTWNALRDKSPEEILSEHGLTGADVCLREGQVREVRVQAVSAQRITFSDTTAYLLDLGNGHSLFAEPGSLIQRPDLSPAAGFTVVQSLDAGYLLGVGDFEGSLAPMAGIAYPGPGDRGRFPASFVRLPHPSSEVLAEADASPPLVPVMPAQRTRSFHL